MNKIIYFLIAMIGLTFISCNNEVLPSNEPHQIPSVSDMVTDLYLNNPDASYDEVEQYVCACFGISPSDLRYETKSNNYVSDSALKLVNKMSMVDPSVFDSKADYIYALTEIVNTEASNLNDGELDALIIAISISADVLELQYGGVDTKGFKDWCKEQWENWGRCAAGIVGGAGTGALAGAGIAAIPTVGIGAGVGAIAGGISGALTGAASAC